MRSFCCPRLRHALLALVDWLCPASPARWGPDRIEISPDPVLATKLRRRIASRLRHGPDSPETKPR